MEVEEPDAPFSMWNIVRIGLVHMTVLNTGLTIVAVLFLSIRIESAQLNLLILMMCWPAVGAILAIVLLYWIFPVQAHEAGGGGRGHSKSTLS